MIEGTGNGEQFVVRTLVLNLGENAKRMFEKYRF